MQGMYRKNGNGERAGGDSPPLLEMMESKQLALGSAPGARRGWRRRPASRRQAAEARRRRRTAVSAAPAGSRPRPSPLARVTRVIYPAHQAAETRRRRRRRRIAVSAAPAGSRPRPSPLARVPRVIYPARQRPVRAVAPRVRAPWGCMRAWLRAGQQRESASSVLLLPQAVSCCASDYQLAFLASHLHARKRGY